MSLSSVRAHVSPSLVVEEPSKSAAEIEHWLSTYLVSRVGLEASSLVATQSFESFASLGLDSLEAEILLTEMEAWLGRKLDSGQIARCGTVQALLDYLVHGGTNDAAGQASGAARHAFERFMNPSLGERLRLLRFDKQFVRGEGCVLEDAAGRTYLDFLASYGALPFGHNPPAIWEAVSRVAAQREPTFIQPAALEAAGELARRLLAIAPPGLRYVTFANSGAEVIEAAIKICRAATGRPGILTTQGGFHGKTLGALSATGNINYHEGFYAPIEHFETVAYGDAEALRVRLDAHPGHFAAFIVEPIQGEGGIIVPPVGYLAAAQKLCKERGVAFVIDEVQTGLGRTGAMFACTAENLQPDVLVLAKALGGGLMPIGACLAADSVYTSRFGLKHSSTFAGNSLACRVGIATLDLLAQDDGALIRRVAENGAFLYDGLCELQRRYPGVLAEVRGRGYMLGLRFHSPKAWRSGSVLHIAADQELYTALVSSYLLNGHGLRVAPTLNGADVVRIEPPLTATRQECERALASIAATVEVLAAEDAGTIIKGILHGPAGALLPANQQCVFSAPSLVAVPEEPPHLAFLVHPLEATQYQDFDRSLANLSAGDLHELNLAFGNLLTPFVAEKATIRTKSGEVVRCDFILVPRTAADLMAMPESQALGEIKDAVELAQTRGARLVGLGAYTSVVVRGGHGVADMGIPITTGNSYTVVAGFEAIGMALSQRGASWAGTTVAVMGAGGAVGRGIVLMMAEHVARLCLIGNPRRSEERTRSRLGQVAIDTCRHLLAQLGAGHRFAPGSIGERLQLFGELPAADAPDAALVPLVEQLEKAGALLITRFGDGVLPLADVVVTATSTPDVLIGPGHPLKRRAIVCDLSRPTNVDPGLGHTRPDVLVIDGGLIEVPGDVDLRRLGLSAGLTYACMAEAILLALANEQTHYSLGSDLPIAGILRLQKLAQQYGFRVAKLRSFGHPITETVASHDEPAPTYAP